MTPPSDTQTTQAGRAAEARVAAKSPARPRIRLSGLRVLLGFLLGPAVGSFVFRAYAAVVHRESFNGETLVLLMMCAYIATVAFGLPTFFVMWRQGWLSCARVVLAGGLVAAAPLWAIALAAWAPVEVFLLFGSFAVFGGAPAGFTFWLVALSGDA